MSNVKRMPGALFCEVFGTYVPRLCVDTAVIGPCEDVKFDLSAMMHGGGFIPIFQPLIRHGVVLKERDEQPRLGQWGLPGGTVFKGETVEDASKRIVRADLGIEIDVLGSIGYMRFPNEERQMEVDGEIRNIVIDSVSIVMLARAQSDTLISKKARIGWFMYVPPIEHEYHTPFLEARTSPPHQQIASPSSARIIFVIRALTFWGNSFPGLPNGR